MENTNSPVVKKYLDRAREFQNLNFPHWSIQESWNHYLSSNAQREMKPRDFLYASEIGHGFLETFWKLQGMPPTNEASLTARRKMEAGNIYEAIIVWTFRKLGILKSTQGSVRLIEKEDFLPVYGRFDILAGYQGNWDEKIKELEVYFDRLEKEGFDFPFFNVVKRKALETVKYLKEQYPEGLADTLIEVKSVNSIAFWRNDDAMSEPYPHHKRQLTFYLLHNNEQVRAGKFIYIDRDTMALSEIPQLIDMKVVEEIYTWLEKMTNYYRNNITPTSPEIIIYDPKVGKYVFNWEVERSEYKNKILEGVDQSHLIEDMKLKNKTLKEREKMRKASEDEDFRGIKKYQSAIEMLNGKTPLDEIVKKTGVPLHALMHYVEDLKNDESINI